MRVGRALARPFVDVAAWYTRVAIAKPVVTAFVTSGLKTSAADMFAQKVCAEVVLQRLRMIIPTTKAALLLQATKWSPPRDMSEVFQYEHFADRCEACVTAKHWLRPPQSLGHCQLILPAADQRLSSEGLSPRR